MLNLKNARGSTAAAENAATSLAKKLRLGTSKISLGATMAVTVAAGAVALAPEMALAQATLTGCFGTAGGTNYDCGPVTTNERSDVPELDGRWYQADPDINYAFTINEDTVVSGYGLAIVNIGNGDVSMDNSGSIIISSGDEDDLSTAIGTAADAFIKGNSALYLESNGGDISYTGDGLIANYGGGNGLGVVSGGGSVVNLTVEGSVFAANGAAISVVDGDSPSGQITIATVGQVTGQTGIVVDTATEDAIDITAEGDITADGDAIGDGIRVNATGGAASINVAVANVTASDNGISVNAADGTGAIDISAGTVIAGGSGVSVIAQGTSGDITVNVNGDLTLDNAGIPGDVLNDFAAVRVEVNDDDSEANIIINITGAEVEEEGETVTQARTIAGADRGDDPDVNWQTGIIVENAGLGGVTLDVDASIFADENGLIIDQTNAANLSDIEIGVTGEISAQQAVFIYNAGIGNITATFGADITATAGSAVDVTASGGDVELTFDGAVTSTGGAAINVEGSGNVTIITNDIVSANLDDDDNGGAAINVRTDAGSISLTTAANVSAESVDGLGLAAIGLYSGEGDVTATIGGDVSAEGFGAAVSAYSELGNVLFTQSAEGTISNSLYGVALAASEGGVTATFDGDVNAANADGQEAIAIYVGATDAIDLTLNGNVTATGDDSYALLAEGESTITVTNTGTITNTDSYNAVYLYSTGLRADVDFDPAVNIVSFTNTGTVNGDVDLYADEYDVNLDNSKLINGYVAISTGGAVNITNDGKILDGIYASGTESVTLTNSDFIRDGIGLSSAGDVTFTNTGNYNFDGEEYWPGEIELTAGSKLVEVAPDGLDTVYGNITLTNSGTMWTNIYAEQEGGNLNLTNSATGVIDAALDLKGAQSGGVTNEGTFNLWYDDSTVQGDFNNSGTLNFMSGGVGYSAASLEVRNFADPEDDAVSTTSTFRNSGLVNMANQSVDSELTIEGDYAASGNARIAMEYLNSGTADQVTIGGDVSGTTTVSVIGSGPVKLFEDNFLSLISVEGDVEDDSFVSGNIFPTTGLVLTNFGRNPNGDQEFGLIQTLNAASRAMGHVVQITETASAVLDESISPYVTKKKVDGKAIQLGAWGRVGTGSANQKLGAGVSGFGLETGGVDKVRTKNNSLQAGVDLGALNIGGGNWSVNLGVTGGWYEADANIYGLGTVDIEADFLGGYAVIGNGKFTLEGQMRREWRDLSVSIGDLTAGPLTGESKAWLGNVRASYRIGAEAGVALTPFADYRFGTSKFDSITIDDLASFQQANHKRKHIELGAELGYRKFAASGLNFEPFVGAAWLKNDSNRAAGAYIFSEDEAEFGVGSVAWDEAVRLSWGLKAESATGRYGLFLNGNTIQAKDVKSVGVNVGARINF